MLNDDPFFAKVNIQISSLLSVPIRCEEGIIGVINLCDKAGGKGFTEADKKLVLSVGMQLGIAVKNLQRWIQFDGFTLKKLYLCGGKLPNPEEVLKEIVQYIETICTNADCILSNMKSDDPNKDNMIWIKDRSCELNDIFKVTTKGIL